ncbi:hypothetical protein [Rhodococcus koreensis]|uniref:Uncharacterized protein n=1 Tax=Rhodococcus koreensis TaxID=99653 RepID=A0A1H5EP57_9NOCA|nr:hypothetical protein [Rhodococcus koreensis]SED92849.1 hypothetical protein SAMN04490239_9310 [Rhodococcus koreensis]
MTTQISDVLIELDARGRANLGRFSKNARFLAHSEEDGTIVLQPARIVTAAEERLHRNPEVLERVQRAMADTSGDVEV